MVPLKRLALEHYSSKHREDCKRNHFLDDFKLHEVERASIVNESDSVRGYLCTVLEECHSPREEDDEDQRPV